MTLTDPEAAENAVAANRRVAAGLPFAGSLPSTAAGPAPSNVGRAVRQSCECLSRNESRFIALFHHCLLEMMRPPPGESAADSSARSAELVRVLLWSVLGGQGPPTVADALGRLGARMRSEGFPHDGFLVVSHAFLRSARLIHGAEWTSRLSAAWVDYLTGFTSRLSVGASSADDEEVSRRGMLTAIDPPKTPVRDSSGPPSSELRARAGVTPFSLDTVHRLLRARCFPSQTQSLRCPAEARQGASRRADRERSFDLLCDEVALRTSVDLRAPRPDQEFDATLVSRVLLALRGLGHAVDGG